MEWQNYAEANVPYGYTCSCMSPFGFAIFRHGAITILALDGSTCNTYSLPFSAYNQAAIYAQGKFIVLTFDAVYTSVDGINWTYSWLWVTNAMKGLANYGNTFVTVTAESRSDQALVSTNNAQSWSWRTTPTPRAKWRGVAYGNGIFVAIADKDWNNGNYCAMVSTNGLSWTIYQIPTGGMNICFGNGVFMVGCDDGKVMTSVDGVTWVVRLTLTIPVWNPVEVRYDVINNYFIAFSYTQMAKSYNLSDWQISNIAWPTGVETTTILYQDNTLAVGVNTSSNKYVAYAHVSFGSIGGIRLLKYTDTSNIPIRLKKAIYNGTSWETRPIRLLKYQV